MLALVETIIEHTDSVALENLDRITESGFFEKSDKDIILFNEQKDVRLEPFPVGNDTIYVILPTIEEEKEKPKEEPEEKLEEEPEEKDLEEEKAPEQEKTSQESKLQEEEEKTSKPKKQPTQPTEAKPDTRERLDEVTIKSILARIVHFNANSYFVNTDYYSSLDKICETLDEYKLLRLEIIGHTDGSERRGEEKLLAQKRAQALSDYFQLCGIDKSRVLINTQGKSRPVEPNTTAGGRKANRRVEITIIQATVK